MAFTVVFHHSGILVKEPNIHYIEGQVRAFRDLDLVKWSFLEAFGLVKDLGCGENTRLWWKPSCDTFENGLKELKVNKDAIEVANYAVANKKEIDIFVEQNVSEREKGKNVVGAELDDGSYDEKDHISDESVKRSVCDDSEEDGGKGDEDGFVYGVQGVEDARVKLGSDKVMTREDVEGVIGAELRNKLDMTTTSGGVAASMAAAATVNQNTEGCGFVE